MRRPSHARTVELLAHCSERAIEFPAHEFPRQSRTGRDIAYFRGLLSVDAREDLGTPFVMIVEVKYESGYWSVFVNGLRLIDRQPYEVAARMAYHLENPDADDGSGSAAVARGIRAWEETTRT